MIEIAPSILSADFACLGQQVSEALACGVKRIHVDVMDGHFVPNISMGPHVVKCLKPVVATAGAMLETHLMIEQPERYLAEFINAGAELVTVHVETCPHLHRTLQQIRELGAKAGVTLNPATPLVDIEAVLENVDLVLVMTVNPGFGGQKFITSMLDKIRALRAMLDARALQRVPIEVDGGIHTGTLAAVVQAGAAIAVVGSGVFNSRGSVKANLDALGKAAGG
ncbi:MAG: ribulose-phosphate 3-epimerase [Pirellulales bacterium]|nr:ribulose-phosphate 3-epimerase [Pirellulales bacterium]